MTETEQQAWCAMLAPTPRAQYLVLKDLLRHAEADQMTPDDRRICRRQLARLDDLLAAQDASSPWKRRQRRVTRTP